MEHGNGSQQPNAPRPTTYGTPDASIVVFAGVERPFRPVALNELTDGEHVIVAGMVTEIREHGSVDNPRATLQLVNATGQAAYAAADSDTLAEYSLWLMDGVAVSLHGIARQPFAEDPRTTYIQIVRVEPAFG